jgi:signal transduction histidine kinase
MLPRRGFSRGDKSIYLTPTEFRLLSYLAHHPGQALSRFQLLNAVREVDAGLMDERVINVHIRRLDVDLTALLNNIVEPYTSRAEQADLDFNIEIAPQPVLIKGKATQLNTLIQNLLDNAIKFTPQKGRLLYVSVR